MCVSISNKMKVAILDHRIRVLEMNIFKYRYDMTIMNNLYYCGRGDVDDLVNRWADSVYFRIEAMKRLRDRLSRV